MSLYYVVPRKGIQVLASLKPNAPSQWPCDLRIKYFTSSTNTMLTSASISLQFPIDGFDDHKAITLFYDAVNLRSASLSPTAPSLSPDQLKRLRRNQDTQLCTLSLFLKQPCAILPSESIALMHGSDQYTSELGDLSRAYEMHILFDYNWIHPDHRKPFRSIINHPENVLEASLNRDKQIKKLRKPGFGGDSEDLHEAPPPYVDDASAKRCRPPASPGSPPEWPLSKRNRPSTPEVPCSPTEEATTLDDPSPKPPYSPTEKATTASLHDSSPKSSPAPPFTSASDFQQAVSNALETMLPDLLRKTLQDLLPCQPSHSPSPSVSLSPSPPSSNFEPDPTSALRTLLSAHLASITKASIEKLYDRAVSHAAEVRRWADGDFQDEIDNKRHSFSVEVEDMKADLWRTFDDMMAQCKDDTQEILQSVTDQAEMIYGNALDRLDNLERWERMRPSCLPEERGAREIRKTQIDIGARGRRATSLP